MGIMSKASQSVAAKTLAQRQKEGVYSTCLRQVVATRIERGMGVLVLYRVASF